MFDLVLNFDRLVNEFSNIFYGPILAHSAQALISMGFLGFSIIELVKYNIKFSIIIFFYLYIYKENFVFSKFRHSLHIWSADDNVELDSLLL